MFRLSKIAIATATATATACFAGLLFSSGCKPQKGTASPEDYYPLILVALQGGETAAMIGRNQAIDDGDFAGCVASEVFIGAFGSTRDSLSGKLQDQLVVPGFELNLAECLPLRQSDGPEGDDQAAEITEQIAGVALSAGTFYAQKLKAANCKKGTAALGALDYIRGLVPAVAKQIKDPGSPVSVAGVVVDLSQCDDT